MDKWISVEDRLPERGKWLVVATNNIILIGGYDDRYKPSWIDWVDEKELNVSHWMPLPEPPERM